MPAVSSDGKNVLLYLPADLLDRVESEQRRLREASPGVKISRSDAIRSLLYSALDAQAQPARAGV